VRYRADVELSQVTAVAEKLMPEQDLVGDFLLGCELLARGRRPSALPSKLRMDQARSMSIGNLALRSSQPLPGSQAEPANGDFAIAHLATGLGNPFSVISRARVDMGPKTLRERRISDA
jgi:hypothetical protein